MFSINFFVSASMLFDINHLTARNKSPTIRNIKNQIHISTPKNESISYSTLLNFATLKHLIRIRQITRLPEKVSPPDRGGES